MDGVPLGLGWTTASADEEERWCEGAGKLGRRCVAVTMVLGMALDLPAAAAAATTTAGVTGTTLTVQAGPATANHITMYGPAPDDTRQPPFYDVFDDDITPATGCQELSPPIAAHIGCHRLLARIVVLSGTGNDSVNLGGGTNSKYAIRIPTRINGGAGADTHRGRRARRHRGRDRINTVRGNGGNDSLQMRNRTRDTLIDCAGTDTAIIDKIDPRPIACETVLRPA